jgi:hypothetical protein
MIEVLVAVAVLAIAVVIALVLYDAARKSFKKGENVTEQQQAIRIAFDKLNADLRMAGYNTNPDGATNRPDEQIEAAYDTAVVLRADLDDAEEPSLAGGAFQTVSTGNDEIIAYVLAKPDGSSPDTLSFDADVRDVPRTGTVVTVNIPHVALVQNDPPYTLYRITLNSDSSKWGTSDFLVRTPLVENVRSMTFRYLNLNDAQINSTFDLAATTDDIGGSEATANKAERTSIRRITIDLVGLTRDPDLGWEDRADTNPATRAYRKFQLSGDVTPRNLGMKGIRDLMADVTPPAKPGAPSLYPGHCGGLYMTWPDNPASDGVVSYRINYGTSSGSYIGQRTVGSNEYYLGALNAATQYFVTIQALDAAGNQSPMSDERSSTTTNTTTPKVPTDLAATSNLNGSVRLTWAPVTQNTGNVTGDPESPRIRDLGGYYLFRDTSASFTASSSNRVPDAVTTISAQPSPLYLDTGAINCRQYYYRVSAVDAPCGVESTASDVVPGMATSTVNPAAPQNAQAFVAGLGRIRVTWQAVTRDVNDSIIKIDTYKVWRAEPVPEGADPLTLTYGLIGTVAGGLLEHVDASPPTVPTGYRLYYRVSALDDCPNESELSEPTFAQCAFTGNVRITNPIDGQAVAGVVPVAVLVEGGTDTYTKATFTFTHAIQGTVATQEVPGPGPSWSYDWFATPPGEYTITATVENSTGCTKSASIHVTAGDIVGCCLSPPNPTQNPVVMTCAAGHPSKDCTQVSYQMINNGCRTAVVIESMTVTWIDEVGNGTRLKSVGFDGSTIWSLSPWSLSPAINPAFSPPKPLVTLARTSANPVNVTYVFDKTTSNSYKDKGTTYYRRDSMTATYGFRLLDTNGQETSITGTCGPGQGMFGNLIVEQN